MTRRAVFAIEEHLGSGATLRIEEELVPTALAERQAAIDLSSLDSQLTSFAANPVSPGSVALFGSALRDLILSNPAALRQVTAAGSDGCSLMIEDATPHAQALPWEAMQDAQGNFVALRTAPLLGRIVTPRHQQVPIERTFEPPLKVLAVLAAAGGQEHGAVLSALPELRALVRGLGADRSQPVQLRVLGADDDVRAEIEALADPRITFLPLERLETLEDELLACQPHLLHFFCHGFASDDAQPRLELATRSDQIAGHARGSIAIEADTLADLLRPQARLWLMTLNCCLGAAASESISLARDLMSQVDLPAIVAMREAIDRRDAHVFSETLLRELWQLVEALVANSEATHLDWTSVLPAVRVRLCRERCQTLSNAKNCREWTVPVIYVRREPLRVRAMAPALDPARTSLVDKIRGRIKALAASRADLAAVPGLPPSILAEIDKELATLARDLIAASTAVPGAGDVDPPVGPHVSPHVDSADHDEPTDEGNGSPTPAGPAANDAAVPKPPILRLNAWIREPAPPTAPAADWARWALREEAGLSRKELLLGDPGLDGVNRALWSDPRVGWGVVLPDLPGASQAKLAGIDDAPAAIRRLIEARRAILGRVPVFRYRPGPGIGSLTQLHDFAAGNSPTIDGSPIGVAVGSIPQYLLLVGSPMQIPWELQYVLSTVRFVGRLDLEDAALERYVDHLLSGWAGATASPAKTLAWAVVHHDQDITSTLRSKLTRPLHQHLASLPAIGSGAVFLDGKQQPATAASLATALVQNHPGFIATSSHGQTWPLDDAAAMALHLGELIDQEEKLVDPAALLGQWQPDGAVWMAHACCSAGSKGKSDFVGLFDPASKVGQILGAVAALGDRIAPFPTALLSAEKPARAFIGQVEPTFDWTLLHNETGQRLTHWIIQPIGSRLLGGSPVGSVLEPWHRRAAPLNTAWLQMREQINQGGAISADMLYPRLAAADVASTVLLGDPTAVLG